MSKPRPERCPECKAGRPCPWADTPMACPPTVQRATFSVVEQAFAMPPDLTAASEAWRRGER
jgi:hypothetical protein